MPFALLAALVLVLAACSGGSPSATPSETGARSSGPTVAPTTAATAKPRATTPTTPTAPPATGPAITPRPSSGMSPGPAGSGEPTVSTIDWGTIWDALPPGFPAYPGSHAAVTGGDPASATLDLPADGPTASTWYQTALKARGWTIVNANGPREDGSFEISATMGSADCQTEISLEPLGATTTATIYLAAACPFG